ncbi:MAG: hypothetical protein A3F10_06155 [Coxiella sp. RIFCSPHIGHO2_12_FULL_42_15]|nr:MAG: hypothetical protein A3F10_06155 [Coxiella sp. RIFCSPHIGHO2_12_FULL_42_15]
MTLNTWPIYEKPREKLLNAGADSLSNAELLALLLGQGTFGKDAVTLARELIQSYDGLQNLFQASYPSLSAHRGIGLAKYTCLQAAYELGKRCLKEPLARENLLLESHAVKQYLIAELRGAEREIFACLFLDTRFRLIRFEKLFAGTIDAAVIHPREVTKRALVLNAKAVIVAHNHPSGDIEPSQADRNLTVHLTQSLNTVEIDLLDHIIVGAQNTFSFAEFGYL